MSTFVVNKAHLCVESGNALFLMDSDKLDRVVSDITAWLHRWYRKYYKGTMNFLDLRIAESYIQTMFENNFHTKVIVSCTFGENQDVYFCVMSRALVDIEIDLKGEVD